MKKQVLIFIAFIFSLGGFSQPQLTFRFANPRIIKVSGFDHIEYDLQVKCNLPGYYLYSGSYLFWFNNSALSQTAAQWTVTKVGAFNGNNSQGNPKYTVTKTITGTVPNRRFNVALTPDINVIGNGPNPDDFGEIGTDWTTMFTVRGRITTPGLNAGIDFVENLMNGQQSYVISNVAPPYYGNFVNPNLYDSRDLVSTALGRIYSTNWGWSQVGNPLNVQWVDWTMPVNTTVWEGTATITQGDNTAALFNNLNLLNSATLDIQANKYVTVQGNLDNTGSASNLIVRSGASLITQGTITGEGTLESSTSTNAWKLVSPPVPGVTANLFLNQYLQSYNEATNSWSDIIDPNMALSVGKGYAAWSVPVNYTGVFNTGDMSLSVTKNGLGYNLVGNPYPSGLDITNPNTWNLNLGAGKWVWNQNMLNYQTSVNTIPPAQGFFVLASASGSFTLPNSARTHTSLPLVKNGESNELRLYVEGNNYADEAFVKLAQGSTNGFDFAYDVPKMYGWSDAPQMYTVIPSGEFTQLSWNVFPDISSNDVVPLHLKVGAETNYTLTASGMETFGDVKITLVDLKQGSSQILNNNPVYSFTASPNDEPGRFLLLFANSTGISNPELSGINIFTRERTIMVNMPQGIQGDIVIYDMVGKELYRTNGRAGMLNQIPFQGATAWYLVKVITQQGAVTEKVFIR
ncbi:MAG: hypothetical protein ACP5O2_12535 [Bacteroidales bacterium]